jgi:bifunctional enzyme CysN/CysC
LHQEHSNVSTEERSARFGQRPVTVLLTGLTGAGKSTVAYALERKLFDQGRSVTVLDGQNMRLRMSRDLGFSDEDRSENLRRTAEVARLMNDAGLICVAAFIAPSAEIRQRAAEAIGDERFLLIHLAASVEVCRQRAPDAYRQADEGAIANFPGVSTAYEVPDEPDLTLPSGELSVTECVDQILQLFQDRGVIR